MVKVSQYCKVGTNRGQLLPCFLEKCLKAAPALNSGSSKNLSSLNYPPPLMNTQHVLPHIRMDQVLDFLLADKLI
ncbi:YcjX family protein [Paraglaciecola psychrophila]|uniref:YcjX family protein n=1 Tax=Paraglaciecola psychrophila TaxID=326544 RepID=UPI002ADE1E17|nr:YcjX family protein [Paraglaciecola psychrophila]